MRAIDHVNEALRILARDARWYKVEIDDRGNKYEINIKAKNEADAKRQFHRTARGTETIVKLTDMGGVRDD